MQEDSEKLLAKEPIQISSTNVTLSDGEEPSSPSSPLPLGPDTIESVKIINDIDNCMNTRTRKLTRWEAANPP